MRQQRLREKQDPEYVTRRERGKTFEDIEAMMVKPNTGNSPESPAGRPSKTHATGTETPQFLAEEVPPLKKKRKLFKFKAAHEKDLDNMPLFSTDMSGFHNGK